ncbi:SMP-30/gluconolactonase/LRE family protein [Crinalium epipsammum]|uniref:SMP-30/gluconolactonase/LRE family protein n=1 Tax=Crinalium epipsammum TaxID=241425 RepID=UPI0018DB0F85|nr:SMP-30/gluconolactonase/LRE family protein [Crinalium epipsammum]
MFYLQKWFGKHTARGYLQPKCQKFSCLFPKSVLIEQVATGFQFTEGLVWIVEDQCLLFSDIPANKIYKLNAAGQTAVFREPSHHANGLTRDRQGCLIACEHGSRRVTRTKPDGTVTVLSDRFGNQKLNSPNDVMVKSDGAIYFTAVRHST